MNHFYGNHGNSDGGRQGSGDDRYIAFEEQAPQTAPEVEILNIFLGQLQEFMKYGGRSWCEHKFKTSDA